MDHAKLLLEDLSAALVESGEDRFAAMARAASTSSGEALVGFLTSNELWGGAGSIADQAAVSQGREARRLVEAALLQLGQHQLQEGIVNVRTQVWVDAFRKWQDGII